MASHSLSIAKASLLASCLRPDFSKLSRDDLAEFHSLLELTISQCSSSNIQKTKEWLCRHILPSRSRTGALGKFLITSSKNADSLPCNPSTRISRRRLHVLYLVNDILHHLKHHETSFHESAEELAQILPTLFTDTITDAGPHVKNRLKQLLAIWQREKYCTQATVAQLTAVLQSGQAATVKHDEKALPEQKELPWIMPSTHGDPSAPFFDLPAANFMPHIVPNSKKSMRPDRIRALQLPAGPADQSLVNAVKDFLKDVQSIDDPFSALEEERIVPDIDELGQITYKNETDDLMGDTYYGWSRSFCEKMQQTSKGNNNKSRSTSRSRSPSRSLSRTPPKHRRYSSSRSRSASPPRFGPSGLGHSSQGPRGSQHPSTRLQPQAFNSASSETTNMQFQRTNMPPQPRMTPLPPNMAQTGFLPPRPPHWQGPWPPPPPPPVDQAAAYLSMPPQFGEQYPGKR